MTCPRSHCQQVAKLRFELNKLNTLSSTRRCSINTNCYSCWGCYQHPQMATQGSSCPGSADPAAEAPRCQPPPRLQSVMVTDGWGFLRLRGKRHQGDLRLSCTPERCECAATFPTAELLPQAHHGGHSPGFLVTRVQGSPGPGHTQEVVLRQLCVWEVSTSEISSRQAPSPGWASCRGRRQMSGETGAGQGSPTHTGCHLGSRRGDGRALETRLGPGQPLAWAGSQAGGWGPGAGDLASRATLDPSSLKHGWSMDWGRPRRRGSREVYRESPLLLERASGSGRQVGNPWRATRGRAELEKVVVPRAEGWARRGGHSTCLSGGARE